MTVSSRHLTLYPLLEAEVEELTSPRMTVGLTMASMLGGISVTCGVVLASVSLDVRGLVTFAVATAISATAASGFGIDAFLGYRKRRRLTRRLLGFDGTPDEEAARFTDPHDSAGKAPGGRR